MGYQPDGKYNKSLSEEKEKKSLNWKQLLLGLLIKAVCDVFRHLYQEFCFT